MSQITTSNWSTSASANTAAAPDGWPEGMAAADINNCAREMMAALKIWYNQICPSVTAGGTADALTLTYPVAPAGYTTGLTLSFFASSSSNTGAATVNVNGLGVRNIYRRDGSTALSAADITALSLCTIVFDGSAFRLLSIGIT